MGMLGKKSRRCLDPTETMGRSAELSMLSKSVGFHKVDWYFAFTVKDVPSPMSTGHKECQARPSHVVGHVGQGKFCQKENEPCDM